MRPSPLFMVSKMPKCKQCGKDKELSGHKLCMKCGMENMLASIDQMRNKKGKYYDKWLKHTLEPRRLRMLARKQ